jgi:osmotically-inducible protein OsmY
MQDSSMNTIPLSSTTTSAICEMAERRLRESPYFFLKWLSCHFDRGVLTLRGRVPNKRLREFAERIVLRVDGVQSIDNQVEVCDPAVWARSA